MNNDLNASLIQSGITQDHYQIHSFRFLREGLKWLIQQQEWQDRLVVMPAFICPVVVEAVLEGGAIPALVDVDPNTWLLDLDLAQLPWEKVAAVIGVHTLGHPDDMVQLRERMCQLAPQACLIEDMAHALFASHGERVIPCSGDVVLISLYKQLPFPLGGIVLLNSKNFSEQANIESLQGEILDRVADELLILKIKSAARTVIVSKWVKNWPFEKWAPLQHPKGKYWQPSWYALSWELTSNYFGHADQVVEALRKNGVTADRLWWDAPVISSKYRPYLIGQCPVARRLAQRVVNVTLGIENVPEILEKIHSTLVHSKND